MILEIEIMKVFFIENNHHPDYFGTKTLFESLEIETDVATEELTLSLGANYCSVSKKDFKFQCGKNWYDPKNSFSKYKIYL
jgi:hypothetical protein